MTSAVVRLGMILPYAGIAVATVTFFVVIAMGRLDLSLKGLYLAVPIIIASVWLIRKKRISHIAAEEAAPSLPLSGLRFTHLTLLNVLILIVSVILLLGSETRPPVYFVLMAAFAGIVVVQILGIKDDAGWQRGIILGSLVLLALNLAWSVTLKYPLYYGDTDILPHLHYIQSLLTASHVTAAMGIYQYTPLYHVLLGSGIQVLGLGLRDGFFVFSILAYVPAILLAALFFKAMTGSERLSLMACLLLAVSAEFIYYGGYMVTRALAFVFFVVILYLIFRQPRSRSAMAVLALVTVALLLAHQTTIFYMFGILALLVGFQWLMAGPRSNHGTTIRFAALYLVVFATAFVSYWLVTSPTFAHYIAGRVSTELGHVPPPVVAPTPDVMALAIAEVPVFFRDRAADMIFLFLGWIGFAYLLKRATDRRYFASTAMGLLGLVCLVFYVPSPIHFIPQFTHLFLVRRLSLLLTVFMPLAMGYGMVILTRSLREDACRVLGRAAIPLLVVLTVAFSFFSMANARTASDAPHFRTSYYGERRYFVVAELHALSFVEQQASPEIPLYSGYLARRYFVDRPAHIITSPDIGYVEEGYVLLRTGELEDRWLLFSGGAFGFGGELYRYSLEDVEPADNILEHLASQDKIYDNGAARSYIIGTD